MTNYLAPTSSPAARFGVFKVRLDWEDDGLWQELEVLSFDGEEEISRPFRFQVRVRNVPDAMGEAGPAFGQSCPPVDRVLGSRVSLSWTVQGAELPTRFVFAQVEAAYLVEAWDASPHVELTLVPPVLLATTNRRSRVFNQMNVEEIAISRTLRGELARMYGGGCDVRTFLHGTERRALTLQVEESDFDFASRLLESIGAAYHFEHDERSLVMVVRHDHAGREVDGHFAAWGAGAAARRFPGFDQLRLGRRAEPRAFTTRGLDDEHEVVEATWTPARRATLSCTAESTVRRRRDRADVEGEARREGRRRSTAQGVGTTTYPCLRVGTVIEDPTPSEERRLLVTKVTHTCGADRLYRAEAVLSPDLGGGDSEFSFTPKLATPRPRIHGVIRGRVVKNEARDSRWGLLVEVQLAGFSEPVEVPLTSGVTNPTTAIVAVPSEGDEVLVAFEDGDPDFPYVVGAVQTDWAARQLPQMRPFSEGTQIAFVAGQTAVALQDQGGASHLHLQAGDSLELRTDTFVQKVEAFQTSVDVSTQAALTVAGALQLDAQVLHISAARVTIDAGMVQCSGLLKCDTIVANSVVGRSYTPGAGNIW